MATVDRAFVTCNGRYSYLSGLRSLFPVSGELISGGEALMVEKMTDADVCYGDGKYTVSPRSTGVEPFEVNSQVEIGPDSADTSIIIRETKIKLGKETVTLIFH